MAVSGAYLDLIATAGKAAITHISLVNSGGTELAARQAASWTGPEAGDGKFYLTSDLEFSITAGETVAAWKGWSAAETGTEYVESALTPESFAGDGTYTLKAGTAATYIDHNVSA